MTVFDKYLPLFDGTAEERREAGQKDWDVMHEIVTEPGEVPAPHATEGNF